MNIIARALLCALTMTVTAAGTAQAEVTVLGWPGGPEEVALRKVAELYNAKPETGPDDQVKLIFFGRDGFWDKLQADMAAGSGEFDINLTATYAVGRYAPYMAPLELPASAASVFPPKVLATMQFGGRQYGVPTDLSLHFMYFRKDLITQLLSTPEWRDAYTKISEKYLGHGLSPKEPGEWTQDDWAATALFFTRTVNPLSPTRYGTVLQMKNLLFNMMVWHSFARAQGGDWRDASGTVTIDSPPFRTALELYKKLYDDGTSPKDSLSYEYAEANAAFGSGQVATMLQWNAAYADLNSAEKNPLVAGKIGTVPPPSGPAGRFTHIHGLGLGLNKSSKHQPQAIKFLDWLAGPDAMVAYAKAGGSPALGDEPLALVAADRPDLVKLGDYAAKYGFVMNGGTSAKALSIYDLQAEQFTGYWAGQKSLDDALAATAKGMTDLLR